MTTDSNRPTLSILVVDDAEKPPSYLQNYLLALEHWNPDCLESGDAEVIVVSQRKTIDDAVDIASRIRFPVKTVHAGHEFVGNTCIWDVLQCVRQAWPVMKGRYLTVNHSEMLWCHDRLWHTIEWLKANPYYIVTGNLRRPGRADESRASWKPGSCSKEISDRILSRIEANDWDGAARQAEIIETLHWPLWRKVDIPVGKTPTWQEEVFFVDREWLDAWELLRHGGPQPFQDIWDLIGTAVNQLKIHDLGPVLFKLPQDINRLVHLWHPKGYQPWNPTVRDWFMKNRERWKETRFVEPIMWQELIDMVNGVNSTQQPKHNLRRGPRGTVTRYAGDMRRYMQNGGVARMKEFYANNGRERRGL